MRPLQPSDSLDELTGLLHAAFCLQRGQALLHADRDFDAYAQHHGLHCWRGVS